MKLYPLSLLLVACAVHLGADGCYHLLATQEELLTDSGNAKFEQGDFAGAVGDFSRAIGLNPANGEHYFRRGTARGALGDISGAMSDLDTAILLRPWDTEILRGRIGFQTGLLDSLQNAAPDGTTGETTLLRMQIVTTRIFVVRDLDRLIAIDPEDSWAHGERGRKRYELGDDEGAVKDFNEVLGVETDADWAYFDRGLAEAALADYPSAVRDFSRVARNDGTDGWAFYHLGLARIHGGDSSAGCIDLRRALTLGVEESRSALEEMCR